MKLSDLWWKVRWSSRATALLHFFAMWAPFNSWRIFFYRLRGTRIGKHVHICQGCYLEESRPWLITIEDGVRFGPGVQVVTHDSFYYPLVPYYRYLPVTVKKGASVSSRAFLMPGVTVGEGASVGANTVVRKDVPPHTLVFELTKNGEQPLMQGVERILERDRANGYDPVAVDLATKWPHR